MLPSFLGGCRDCGGDDGDDVDDDVDGDDDDDASVFLRQLS